MNLRRLWVRNRKSKPGLDPESDTDSAERSAPKQPDDGGDSTARVWAVLSRIAKLALVLVPRGSQRKQKGKGKGKGKGNDITLGFDVVMRLDGDEPAQQRLATVTFDTQCDRMDLMSYSVWKRLNEGRGTLDRVDDMALRTLGPGKVEILGIARGVEWRLKWGSKTYRSDFYVTDMDRFDVLVGSETILRYDLLRPGSDLERHYIESQRWNTERQLMK